MDGQPTSTPARPARRWVTHNRHDAAGPHLAPAPRRTTTLATRPVTLDGSAGEGGGQILRTALTLSLLTGRPFRMVKVRANRDRPGLRPQHLAAVRAAAELGEADVEGDAVGSSSLIFRPRPYSPRDLVIDIGTAGSTGMVLQTLHLPLALRADGPVRLTLIGGTFNTRAPSFPFLETTWRSYLAALGMPLALSMPSAGFYPRGGGQLDAWIEPATPRPLTLLDPGPQLRLWGTAGVARLHHGDIANRMRARALERLAEHGLTVEIGLADWPGPGPGAALSLTAEFTQFSTTTVGLGARGKPAEAVADEAVAEMLAYLDTPGAVDPHSADQILLPLSLAEGRSEYTVTEITEHLRTNIATIQVFLDRPIDLIESDDEPPRVVVG